MYIACFSYVSAFSSFFCRIGIIRVVLVRNHPADRYENIDIVRKSRDCSVGSRVEAVPILLRIIRTHKLVIDFLAILARWILGDEFLPELGFLSGSFVFFQVL